MFGRQGTTPTSKIRDTQSTIDVLTKDCAGRYNSQWMRWSISLGFDVGEIVSAVPIG